MVGDCFKCDQCADYDLCASCYEGAAHAKEHPSHTFTKREAPK